LNGPTSVTSGLAGFALVRDVERSHPMGMLPT
jgi:hypothetical protein